MRRSGLSPASVLARVGIVCAIAAAAVAWIMIGRLAATVDETARVAEDGAVLGVEGAADAAALSRDLVALAAAVGEGIAQLDDVVRETSVIAVQVAEATDGSALITLGTSIDTLNDLAGLSDSLAELTSALSVLGVPSLGAESLAGRLRDGAADLEPIPGELRGIAQQLRAASASLTVLRSDLGQVAAELTTLGADLEATADDLSTVPTRVEEARRDIAALRDDAGTNPDWWRVALVLVAMAFIAACLGLDRVAQRLHAVG